MTTCFYILCVQAMYHYLQDKESFKHSMTVMTTNDYGGEKKLTTNARQNFADRRFYDTSNNSNQPDPLGDLMDWLEEQETSRHTDAVRIKAEIKSEDNDDFFRHATSTNRIVETGNHLVSLVKRDFLPLSDVIQLNAIVKLPTIASI